MAAQTHTTPEPPEELADDGAQLWRDVTGRWGLEPNELAILRELGRLRDRIAAMDRRLDAEGLTIEKRNGDLAAHPLLAETTRARTTYGNLWTKLRLPDPATGRVPENGGRPAGWHPPRGRQQTDAA
jgi:hypothetical protein